MIALFQRGVDWCVAIFWCLIFAYKKWRAGFVDLGQDITVTGTVVWLERGEDNLDGDSTFNLKLDPGQDQWITAFGGRLTTENETYPATLHCEIVPLGAAKFAKTYAKVQVGTRVRVSGRWGFDGVHTGRAWIWDFLYALRGHKPNFADGWCEIHPVTALEVLPAVDPYREVHA